MRAALHRIESGMSDALENWRRYGELLAEGRNQFLSDKLFGQWIIENELDVLNGKRLHTVDRSNAKWLAESWSDVSPLVPELKQLHPTQIRHDLRRLKRENAARAKVEARAKEAVANNHVDSRILHMDMRDLDESDVPSESIAALITDPPYQSKNLDLHEQLYALAVRVLKPGAWLAVLAGTFYLPRLLKLMPDSALCWRGALIWYMRGGATRFLHHLGVHQSSKLVLLYQKPPLARLHESLNDTLVIENGDQAQDQHPWQQSVLGFEKIVKATSHAGDTILDPFHGSGTTGYAANALGRHYIGVEIKLPKTRNSANSSK
jgi:hypothetical protein